MNIHIKLIGLFKIDRFSEQYNEYPDGTKVQDVIKALQLPQQHCGIMLINGVHGTNDSLLADGDQLVIIPLVDGG